MDGWASIELTRAAMLGFRVSPPSSSFFSNIVLTIHFHLYLFTPPAGGWVMVAPMNMIGSRKILGRISGARIVLIPP